MVPIGHGMDRSFWAHGEAMAMDMLDSDDRAPAEQLVAVWTRSTIQVSDSPGSLMPDHAPVAKHADCPSAAGVIATCWREGAVARAIVRRHSHASTGVL